MKRKCPKCNRELDPNKDFCVICGESYKNKDLDIKTKEQLEKYKDNDDLDVITIIIYGLGIILLGPFVLGIIFLVSIFGVNPDKVLLNNPILIVLLLFISILIIGIVLSFIKDNNKEKKDNKK